MGSKGTKRRSPGAEDEKNTLHVELNEDQASQLETIQKQQHRIDLFLERETQLKHYPVYEKRREVVKSIPNFWPVALMNHGIVAFHAQHNADQTALSYLEDLWVTRDPNDHRCFTIEFFFKENQFFKNKVLKKEYRYNGPTANGNEKPDENGITDSMLDFSWAEHVKISGTKPEWKSDDKSLTKSYPREADEDDELPAEAGSFFNLFEHDDDPFDIGPAIANEVFTNAIEYFLGNVDESDIDSEEEDEEDDDDDAEEIDLEKPRPKKQKV